jgi:hypothetical protein
LLWDCQIIRVEEQFMNAQTPFTARMLMFPTLSWGLPPPAVPEFSMLPLLAAGGVVRIAVKFIKRKQKERDKHKNNDIQRGNLRWTEG